jgi:hypothetical protein
LLCRVCQGFMHVMLIDMQVVQTAEKHCVICMVAQPGF